MYEWQQRSLCAGVICHKILKVRNFLQLMGRIDGSSCPFVPFSLLGPTYTPHAAASISYAPYTVIKNGCARLWESEDTLSIRRPQPNANQRDEEKEKTVDDDILRSAM